MNVYDYRKKFIGSGHDQHARPSYAGSIFENRPMYRIGGMLLELCDSSPPSPMTFPKNLSESEALEPPMMIVEKQKDYSGCFLFLDSPHPSCLVILDITLQGETPYHFEDHGPLTDSSPAVHRERRPRTQCPPAAKWSFHDGLSHISRMKIEIGDPF